MIYPTFVRILMEQVNVRIPRLLLSALFCLFAAFAFGQNKELEKANEIETKREMKTKRLAMTDTLWDITK